MVLEELQNLIKNETANITDEMVIVCGVNAYDKLCSEMSSTFLTNKCKEVLGLPLYCLNWLSTDQIIIGGKELLIPPNVEMRKQKIVIENTAEMIKNGKLLRRPCKLGTTVYIVENGKMYQGTVIRYEQVLSPKKDKELLLADIELPGLNVIVRRFFSEFGKNIFVEPEEAKNKLKEQISNK